MKEDREKALIKEVVRRGVGISCSKALYQNRRKREKTGNDA